MLEHIERPFFTPIYDHISPRAVFGRVALIGDALSVARPHIGMGVTKAADDARVLAEQLEAGLGSIEQSLAAFEAARLPVAVKAVARGRDLGDYMRTEMQAEDFMDPSARPYNDDDLHSPRGILEHTASSAFLQHGPSAAQQQGAKS
jgi:2-polyprenyl-6-methoxyphenol hydroxylase-like FAD-dependent oxidoreductase